MCALAPDSPGRPLAAPTAYTESHPGLPLPLHYPPPALLRRRPWVPPSGLQRSACPHHRWTRRMPVSLCAKRSLPLWACSLCGPLLYFISPCICLLPGSAYVEASRAGRGRERQPLPGGRKTLSPRRQGEGPRTPGAEARPHGHARAFRRQPTGTLVDLTWQRLPPFPTSRQVP